MPTIPRIRDWPAADRNMWEQLVRPGGPLDDHGALSHLRSTSLGILEEAYGRWLFWLSAAEPAALGESPVMRATSVRLAMWQKDLDHLAPMTREMAMTGVVRVITAAAPDRDWSREVEIARKLRRFALRSRSDRKLGRVLSSSVLFRAGLKLATSEADAATTEFEKAKRRKDGTMIAILALLPMRRRAFVELRLGRSVHIADSGIYVSLSEEMTKSGIPWETLVPEQGSTLLRRYILETRAFLMSRGGHTHDYLWVGSTGAPYALSHFGNAIARITQRITGVPVSPHLFRDAAATTLARTSSASATLIPPVLAHTNFGTAERHYIQAGSIEAGRDYAAVIARIKKEGR